VSEGRKRAVWRVVYVSKSTYVKYRRQGREKRKRQRSRFAINYAKKDSKGEWNSQRGELGECICSEHELKGLRKGLGLMLRSSKKKFSRDRKKKPAGGGRWVEAGGRWQVGVGGGRAKAKEEC